MPSVSSGRWSCYGWRNACFHQLHTPPLKKRGFYEIALADIDRSAETQLAHFACAGRCRVTRYGTSSGTGPAATPSGCGWPCSAPAFARSMGQLCGPLLLKRDSLARFAARTPRLLLCLGIFLAAYGMLPFMANWAGYAPGMIFVAHLASNVLLRRVRLACSVIFRPGKSLLPAVKPGAGKRSAPHFSLALQLWWLPGLAQYRRYIWFRQRLC